MVVLKNIKINGNIISCNYYPENKDLPGYIEWNIETQTLEKVDYSVYGHWQHAYVNHASHGLRDIVKEIISEGKPIPEKYTVMWY